MTEKLYENESLRRTCRAVVLACQPQGQDYLIELDRTVLFPEGGGQLSDKGKIGPACCSYVFERGQQIFHQCDRPLAPGQEVEVEVDWPVRLDRMQQHLGEHLLSYACFKLFQANNIGFHMNEDFVTIDLDKNLTREQLLQAELFTNEIIWENRPVTVSYIDSSQAAQYKDRMRKFNSKLSGTLRIVAVEGADMCTCCGLHPPFTGMLGSVKVVRSEKHKEGCRVEFLCGKRALLDADAKNAHLAAAAQELACKPEQVPERLAKLKRDLAVLHEESKAAAGLFLDLKLAAALEKAVTKADGSRLLTLLLEQGDGKEAKLLLPKLDILPDTVSLVVVAAGERLNYMVVRGSGSQADCRAYIKAVNAALGGRGGGKADCAQGGAPYQPDWQAKVAACKTALLAL